MINETGKITATNTEIGVVTRYVIALADGGTLTVVRQNLETAAAEALEAKGRDATVAWREDQTFDIDGGAPAPDSESKGGSS